MKALFLSFALSFVGMTASAQACPDLRGTYENVDLVQTTLIVKQNGCQSVTIEVKKVFESGMVQSHTRVMNTDGIPRENTAGLIETYQFEGAKLKSEHKLKTSTQFGVWYLNEEGNLVSVAQSFPSVVTMKDTFRRVTAP